MGELDTRRSQTAKRISELRAALDGAEQRASGVACVYATGSFARGEASSHSDLDLFIAGRGSGQKTRDGVESSLLRRLDEICIKADLIEVTRKFGIPEFSGDGQYLTSYSVTKLIRTLGKPEDDLENTFTARLLLLLESCPLVGDAVYNVIVEEVISAYWGEYENHKAEFMPAFLANDILRLWRTFCVNYEARTSNAPPRENAKRKLKNFKLKHSRLLTCYSGLLYLLAIFAMKKSVSPNDAVAMVQLTPTRRLEWLRGENAFSSAAVSINKLLAQYDSFLSITNSDESTLIALFEDNNSSRELMMSARSFGDALYEVLRIVGETGDGIRFYRLLVV